MLPPDNEFLWVASPETKSDLQEGKMPLAAVIIMDRPLNVWEDLQMQNMKGGLVPAHWTNPIHVAFMSWCETTGTFVVVAKVTLNTKQWNHLAVFGKVTKW